MSATSTMIAAAWDAWHVRHKGKLGPGPGFVEAINAALAASDTPTRQQILAHREAATKVHFEMGQVFRDGLGEYDALPPLIKQPPAREEPTP